MREEDCEFLRLKGEYDAVIQRQQEHNAAFMELATKTNDALVELADGLKPTIAEIQEQLARAQLTDEAVESQLKRALRDIEILQMNTAASQREIRDLRAHLDDGYQRKLQEAIEQIQRRITAEGNQKLMQEMMEMVKHVVVGRVDIEKRKTDHFWNWLIKLTAAGGLAYMIMMQIMRLFEQRG